MTGSKKYVSGSFRYERIDDVGHWRQLEAPEEVNRLLLDFLPETTYLKEKGTDSGFFTP